LILSKVLGCVKNGNQLESAFQAYDSIRRPRAQRVVQESREVGLAYFLVHPQFGHDLQKITDEANKRLPLIWWHDLDGDVKKAQDSFKALIEGSGGKVVTPGAELAETTLVKPPEIIV
jgi:salicylate hydroxylase